MLQRGCSRTTLLDVWARLPPLLGQHSSNSNFNFKSGPPTNYQFAMKLVRRP
eukprot:gene7420-biopygen14160